MTVRIAKPDARLTNSRPQGRLVARLPGTYLEAMATSHLFLSILAMPWYSCSGPMRKVAVHLDEDIVPGRGKYPLQCRVEWFGVLSLKNIQVFR